MPFFSTSGILLRKIEYGDYDLILVFLTKSKGKISVIAKNAKKSVKRFAGILEPFFMLDIVCKVGKGNLAVLCEADLINSYGKIRTDINKTAYASYWVEIISSRIEDGCQNSKLFDLLNHVLDVINKDCFLNKEVSILFLMKFLLLWGTVPLLEKCCVCGILVEEIKSNKIRFEIEEGGILCSRCTKVKIKKKSMFISKGTIKRLLWIKRSTLLKADRVCFPLLSLKESLFLLESFTGFYLGKEFKSLKFLNIIKR